MSSLTGLIYPLEATMAPLEASIVFGIELGENVTVTLASANLLMLGAVSSPKIIFLFYFYNMAAPGRPGKVRSAAPGRDPPEICAPTETRA